MSVWDRRDDRSAIRLFAVLLLLDRADQALSSTSRMAGNSPQAEGGRPAGRPPAPVPCPRPAARAKDEDLSPHAAGNGNPVHELAFLLKREIRAEYAGADMRRIAELLELLELGERARRWWKKAALMGDEDARNYLEILETEEEAEAAGRGTGLRSSTADPSAGSRLRADWASLLSAGPGPFTDRPPVPVAPRPVVREGRESSPEDTQGLMREIEEYLPRLDQAVDGGRYQP